MDVSYLRKIHHTIGAQTRTDATVTEAQERIGEEMRKSVNYRPEAKVNGKPQPMCLVPTQVRYKVTFICFPGDNIESGDVIESFGEFWLVIETNTSNPIQTMGMAWLCNHRFRFQNWSSEIIERWGVLDSGVYSTTMSGNEKVQETDKQFRVYLPYDDDTKKIYVDKRFAVDTRYDAFGKEILECYQVTGSNHVARSYGQGAHLLILEVRSENYSEGRDNKELLICDYIAPDEDVPAPSDVTATISGRNSIPLNGSRKYSVKFTDNRGNVLDDMVAVWSIEDAPCGVALIADGDSARIETADDQALAGATVKLRVADTSNTCEATKKVVITP